MAWTTDDIPDQHGRTAVVTGANSGLGLETARALAQRGARVVMAVRDVEKAERARKSIAAEAPGAQLEIRELDLASLDSVRACGDALEADLGRVDVLVNNAGLMGIPHQQTAEAFEMQLGVNHLGHFVLTRRLLPALLRAASPRVVSVTSFARLMGHPVDPQDPHQHGSYDPWQAYGRSKLANLHFAMELQRRFERAGVAAISVAAHPGLSHTDLQARSVRETRGGLSQRFWHVAARYVGMPPEWGVLSQLRAATEPGIEGGTLVAPLWGAFGPPVHRPLLPAGRGEDAGPMLWDVSERETGEIFDVAAVSDPA